MLLFSIGVFVVGCIVGYSLRPIQPPITMVDPAHWVMVKLDHLEQEQQRNYRRITTMTNEVDRWRLRAESLGATEPMSNAEVGDHVRRSLPTLP